MQAYGLLIQRIIKMGDEKTVLEIDKLKFELEKLKEAQTTSDACKAIQEFAGSNIAEDKLAGDGKDNKYHQKSGGKDGCCIVM